MQAGGLPDQCKHHVHHHCVLGFRRTSHGREYLGWKVGCGRLKDHEARDRGTAVALRCYLGRGGHFLLTGHLICTFWSLPNSHILLRDDNIAAPRFMMIESKTKQTTRYDINSFSFDSPGHYAGRPSRRISQGRPSAPWYNFQRPGYQEMLSAA